jgi:signal transduction histidine kinase
MTCGASDHQGWICRLKSWIPENFMEASMGQARVEKGSGWRTYRPTGGGPSSHDERAAQRLTLLNTLLMVSFEDISLERQLLCALDLLLTIPWLSLRPQAAIFLVGTDTSVLELAASRGLPETVRAACALVPVGHCVYDCAAHADSVFTHCFTDSHDVRCDHMPAHGHYGIPLRQNGKSLGVLALYLKDGRHYDPEEARFLNVIASTLVSIVVRSRATQHVQQLLTENRQLNQRLIALQEEEYRHLARELHDEIGQSIAAIKTEAVLLPQARASDDVQRSVHAIGAAADRIYDSMHMLVRRLRPGVLDDLGLMAALEAHVAEWHRQRPAVTCRLDVHGRFDDLDEPTNITVYRFVQECLTNVVRHSAATEVKISLACEMGTVDEHIRGRVVLCVSDNGRGADLVRMRERGGRFGLLGMRERVEGLGGTLAIDGGPGQGFRLTAVIPVPERRKG